MKGTLRAYLPFVALGCLGIGFLVAVGYGIFDAEAKQTVWGVAGEVPRLVCYLHDRLVGLAAPRISRSSSERGTALTPATGTYGSRSE